MVKPNHAHRSSSTRDMEVVTALESQVSTATATPDAFAEWVRPHLGAMRRLAARLSPQVDADDVVQEALLRAWRKRVQFDPRRGTPAAWLLAIAADQALQARRRRRPALLIADVSARVHSADDAVDVEFAIANLPPRQRLAVDCFYFVGLSVAETATVMRCSEGTVKSTLFDARERLRPLLEVRNV
jgi:RNA polymerase sigma-70 factor (ECF subfamily)